MNDNHFVVEQINASELPVPILQVIGSAPGRLLRFRNAALARVEINKNRDRLTRQNLADVAATLPLLAIDNEHNAQQVVGYYTDARVANDALMTDGVVFADRFPDVALALASDPPQKQFSIEAHSKQAACSICHNVFESESEYCAHLKNRRASGAVREFPDEPGMMSAVGGAVTGRPAGTDTTVDPNQIAIIASITLEADQSAAEEDAETLTFATDLEYNLWARDQLPPVLAKKLSYQEKKALPAGDFALIQKVPSKRDPKKKLTLRRFPIGDCAHARNALARLPLAQGLSSTERAEVKRKATAKLNSAECLREAPSRKERMNHAKAFFQAAVRELNPVAALDPNAPAMSPVPNPYWRTGRGVVSPMTYVDHTGEPFIAEILRRSQATLAGRTLQNEVSPDRVVAAYLKHFGDVKPSEIESERDQVRAVLQDQLKHREKPSPTLAASQGGVGGISWDIPAPTTREKKITASWK